MDPTQWDCELVTDPAAQRARLDKPKVMRVRRRPAAHHAWLPGYELPVLLIAQAHRFPQCTDCALLRSFIGLRRKFLASGRIRSTGGHHALDGDTIGWARAITDRREPCPKPFLDNSGISCCERVLDSKIAMRPQRGRSIDCDDRIGADAPLLLWVSRRDPAHRDHLPRQSRPV